MRSFLALPLTLLAVTAVSAAPGDPRVVQGTLVWPPVLGQEKHIVVQGADGARYVADVASAHNLARVPLKAGDAITFAGLEGERPNEINVAAMGLDDAITISASRGAPTAMAQAQPAERRNAGKDSAASNDVIGEWQRVDGWIESIAGTTMELRTRDSRRISVDLSGLNHPQWLKTGQEVTVYGYARPEGGMVAAGFIQREPAGSASR